MGQLYRPYAYLGKSQKSVGNETYYIRFNPLCSKHFKGKNRARVMKSTDDAYIVIEPYVEYEPKREYCTRGILMNSGSAYIHVAGFVNDGFFRAEWFGTGARHKVKKDSKGRIYVCINDVYEQEGDEDAGE